MGAKGSKEKSASPVDKERQYRTEYRAYNSPNYGPKPKPRSPSLDDFKPFSKIDRANQFRPPGSGPVPKAPPPPSVTVEKVDFLREDNGRLHHTLMYDTDKLVLRRGDIFRLLLCLSGKMEKLDDFSVRVSFKRGKRASYLEGSKFEALIGGVSPRAWEWPGKLESHEDKEMTVAVGIPPDAPVGEYDVEVKMVDFAIGGEQTVHSGKMVVLFNPWNKDDEVYMEGEEERKEYVLRESGKIWAGVHHNTFTWPWEFEQFESYSLEAALYLLDRCGLSSDLRRSPIHVARTCTQMVNADDNDGGILYGNWSGNYYGGTQPTSWSGSGAILEQYWRTKRAVKWAQCWVFGGTLTSVLRSLGIPSRPVTNFVSAHDTDATRSVDYYLDPNYEEVARMCSDSIWNYHVWVEAWMERPDLRGAYGGWQALDATPQEPSSHSAAGVFTLGPAPVIAIKEGEDMKFDTEFVISEVNADVCYYLQNEKTGMFTQMKTNTSKVGKMILTKAVGSGDPVDIMSEYKYKEYTLEERAALKSSRQRGSGGDSEDDDEYFEEPEDEEPPSEMQVDIVSSDDVCIGEDMRAKLVLRSSSRKYRKVKYSVKVSPVNYKGGVDNPLAEFAEEKKLGPNETCEIPLEVPPSQYLGLVREQYLLNITVFVSCEELDYHFVEKEVFRFRTPDINMVLPVSSFRVGENVSVTASFKNPFEVELTGVEWYVEGSTLTPPRTIIGECVPPNGDATVTFDVTPRSSFESEHTLVITFQSDRLSGIMGCANLKITPRV